MNKSIFAVCFVPKHGNKETYQKKVINALTNEGLINLDSLEGGGLIPVIKENSLFLYIHSSPLVQAKVKIAYSLDEAEAERTKIKEDHKLLINSIFGTYSESRQSRGLILCP